MPGVAIVHLDDRSTGAALPIKDIKASKSGDVPSVKRGTREVHSALLLVSCPKH